MALRVASNSEYLLAILALFAGLTLESQPASAADALPEPGPQSGGLRLRWMITPRTDVKTEGYNVRIDFINVSAKPVNLKTNWEHTDGGDVKKYLTSMLAIESQPAYMPMRGATGAAALNTQPKQSELRLMAGGTLTLEWQAAERTLKPTPSASLFISNPTFRIPGLYSVHATIVVTTDIGEVKLRSNEQLVPFGGSHAMPKHTYGRLASVNAKEKTATLALGSLQQMEVGERFNVTSKQYGWRLTITEVSARFAEGKLENISGDANQPLPEKDAEAELELEERP